MATFRDAIMKENHFPEIKLPKEDPEQEIYKES